MRRAGVSKVLAAVADDVVVERGQGRRSSLPRRLRASWLERDL